MLKDRICLRQVSDNHALEVFGMLEPQYFITKTEPCEKVVGTEKWFYLFGIKLWKVKQQLDSLN